MVAGQTWAQSAESSVKVLAISAGANADDHTIVHEQLPLVLHHCRADNASGGGILTTAIYYRRRRTWRSATFGHAQGQHASPGQWRRRWQQQSPLLAPLASELWRLVGRGHFQHFRLPRVLQHADSVSGGRRQTLGAAGVARSQRHAVNQQYHHQLLHGLRRQFTRLFVERR